MTGVRFGFIEYDFIFIELFSKLVSIVWQMLNEMQQILLAISCKMYFTFFDCVSMYKRGKGACQCISVFKIARK